MRFSHDAAHLIKKKYKMVPFRVDSLPAQESITGRDFFSHLVFLHLTEFTTVPPTLKSQTNKFKIFIEIYVRIKTRGEGAGVFISLLNCLGYGKNFGC